MARLLLLLLALAAGRGDGRSPGPPTGVQVPRAGGAQAEEDDLGALRAELVLAFEDLAAVAQSGRLYAQRDELYLTLIELDPDHAAARKALGYKRTDGRWKRGKYRVPTDRGDEEALETLRARRREHADRLGRRLEPVVAGLPEERREEIVAPFFRLDEENALLNRLIGRELDDGGRWRDSGELAWERRMAELRAVVAEETAAVPELAPWDVEAPADDVGLDWTASWRTPRIKAAGTGSAEEVRRVTEVAHLMDGLLRRVVPPPTDDVLGPRGKSHRRIYGDAPSLGRFRLYLLADPGEIPRLLSGWTHLSEQELELLPTLWSGYLDESNSIGVWVGDETRRLDTTTRQIIGAYLRDHYGLTTEFGWVWEGFGLYLTYTAIGTRLTIFIQPSNYLGQEVTMDPRLLGRDADWVGELVRYEEEGKRPGLPFLVGKSVNEMSVRDLVLSYGLAAWLIETQPDRIPRLLARLKELEGSRIVLESTFDATLPELEERLYRWAEERTAWERAAARRRRGVER